MECKSYKFKETQIDLIPLGDLHIGDKAFTEESLAKLKGYIEYIKNHSNAYAFLMGDLINCATVDSKSSPFCQNMDLNEQIAMAVKLFMPIKDKILGAIDGNHECFDEQTEILTKDGWKNQKDINKDTILLTYNKDQQKIQAQKPIEIQRRVVNEKLNRIINRHTDLLITDNHRLLFNYGSKTEYRIKPLSEMTVSNNRVEFKCAGTMNNKEYNIKDDELKIIAWLLTDGHISKEKQIGFSQRKSKYKMITKILDNLKWKYSVSEYERKDIIQICGKKLKSHEPCMSIRLNSPHNHNLLKLVEGIKKKIPPFINNISDRQFDVFLNSFIDGDGSRHISAPETSLMVYGTKEILEQLQSHCFLHNYRTSLSVYREKDYRLNITPNTRTCFDCFKKYISKEHYSGIVWDVTTPNDTVIVRRNGKISITGNCRLSRFAGYSPTISICERLGIPYMKNSAVILFRMCCHGPRMVPRASFSGYFHHCFDDKTELLTREGWKNYKDIKKGIDEALTLNTKTGKMEWKVIHDRYIWDDFKEMIHFKSKTCDIKVTEDHTLLNKSRDRIYYLKDYARDCYKKDNNFPCAGINSNKMDYPITDDMMKLLAWVLTEGTTFKNKKHEIRITQSDKPKVDHLHILNIINNLTKDFEVKTNTRLKYKKGIDKNGFKRNYDAYEIYINKCSLGKKVRELIPDKIIPDWFFLLSKRQFDLLLYEMILGDGHIDKRDGCNNFSYSQKDKTEMDKIQALCAFNGYRTVLGKQPDGTYRLSMTERDTHRIKPAASKIEKYSGKAWCVSVDNKTLVVRRNGKITITGNTTGGGSTMGSKINKPEQLRGLVGNCDFYCGAHNHSMITGHTIIFKVNETTEKIEQLRQIVLTTGGYLQFNDSYVEEKMLPPMKIGSPKISLIVKRSSANDDEGTVKKDIHISL